jgi:hypothetical protein
MMSPANTPGIHNVAFRPAYGQRIAETVTSDGPSAKLSSHNLASPDAISAAKGIRE